MLFTQNLNGVLYWDQARRGYIEQCTNSQESFTKIIRFPYLNENRETKKGSKGVRNFKRQLTAAKKCFAEAEKGDQDFASHANFNAIIQQISDIKEVKYSSIK